MKSGMSQSPAQPQMSRTKRRRIALPWRAWVIEAMPTAWTYGLNTESTYDWKNKQWSVPVNATVAKLLKVGGQAVSVGGGLRYWAEGPGGVPHGWGSASA